jgi:hypothetical protein
LACFVIGFAFAFCFVLLAFLLCAFNLSTIPSSLKQIRMPFYHALFKNATPTKNNNDAGYWTSGGEYNGLFNEEFARDKIQPDAEAELVVVHFFSSEDELVRFHQAGSWKSYMR